MEIVTALEPYIGEKLFISLTKTGVETEFYGTVNNAKFDNDTIYLELTEGEKELNTSIKYSCVKNIDVNEHMIIINFKDDGYITLIG
jgi:hypothetical protein